MRYEEKFCILLEAVIIVALIYLSFDLSIFIRNFPVPFELWAVCRIACLITAIILFFRLLDRYVDRHVPSKVDEKKTG